MCLGRVDSDGEIGGGRVPNTGLGASEEIEEVMKAVWRWRWMVGMGEGKGREEVAEARRAEQRE